MQDSCWISWQLHIQFLEISTLFSKVVLPLPEFGVITFFFFSYSFHVLIVIYLSSLVKHLLRSFYFQIIFLFVLFLWLCFESPLCILNTSPFPDYGLKIFSSGM